METSPLPVKGYKMLAFVQGLRLNTYHATPTVLWHETRFKWSRSKDKTMYNKQGALRTYYDPDCYGATQSIQDNKYIKSVINVTAFFFQ